MSISARINSAAERGVKFRRAAARPASYYANPPYAEELRRALADIENGNYTEHDTIEEMLADIYAEPDNAAV